MSTRTPAHRTALALASEGWHTFQLSPNSKTPPAGSRGFLDASSDPSLIDARWFANPDRNLGVRTGYGADVLDFDKKPDRDGEATLVIVERRFDLLQATVGAWTPSGGFHLYFAPTPGLSSGVDVLAAFGPGGDLRAGGGYVVCPPSRLPTGAYRWMEDRAPWEHELATMPDWLVALLRDRQRATAGPAEPSKRVRKLPPRPRDRLSPRLVELMRTSVVPEGRRNRTVFDFAMSMLANGYGGRDTFNAALRFNAERCSPPLSDKEVAGIVDSAAGYALNILKRAS